MLECGSNYESLKVVAYTRVYTCVLVKTLCVGVRVCVDMRE